MPKVYKHEWNPEKPDAYSDQFGNSINFTLDSYVTVYEASTQTWIHGYREKLEGLTNIPLINNEEHFEKVGRSTIVKAVQKVERELIERNILPRSEQQSIIFTMPREVYPIIQGRGT